jgi:anionic cell wall polymer biosynthesis LytR-Cps2A-Psr (LCP) family protein
MKGRNAILVLLGIFIVLGAVAGIIAVQLFYRQPFISQSTLLAMGSLTPVSGTPGSPTPIRILTATPDSSNPAATPASSPEVLNTPGPTDTPGPLKEVCGTTGSYIILVVGTDVTSQDLEKDGAIGFRIVQVNFSGERIMVYGIPPELVMTATNLQPYGLSESTLANAFDTVYSVERSNADAVSRASNAVAQMINENLGILASHYMVIDTAAVENYINKMGSMDVKVGATFVSDEFDLQRGWHKMDGALIRKYITTKTKDGKGEWDRILRQNDVVNSFRTLASQQDTITFLRGFISQAEDGFATDLNNDQLVQLMCLTNSIEPVRFRYYNLPQARVTAKDDGTLVINDSASLRANISNTLGSTGE